MTLASAGRSHLYNKINKFKLERYDGRNSD